MTMTLSSQESFNKSLYDHINRLADKIESGVTPENFMYLTDDLIDVLKRSEKYLKENIPYDSDSTVNSYQVRELKQIIRYLKSMKTELYQEPFSAKLDEPITTFQTPDGYTPFKSFMRVDDNWDGFRSNGGSEVDEGVSKSISGQSIYLNRHIVGISYDQANKGRFHVIKGTVFYWRYV